MGERHLETAELPRPAVPVAAGFVLGVAAVGYASAAWGAFAGIACLLLGVRLPAGRLRRWAWGLACASAGLAWAEARTEGERPAGIPAPGTAVDVHVEGRLLGAPEVDPDGERRLDVLGRIGGDATDSSPGTARPVRVRLRVAPSPPGPTTRLDALRAGDRLRVWCRLRGPRRGGNPGDVEPRRSLEARGIDATGFVKSARLVRRLERGRPSLGRVLDRWRVRAERRLARRVAEADRRAVLAALLLGRRATLGEDVRRTLRDAGLAHLLAISGLHVGLVLLVGVEVVRRGVARPWSRLLVLAPGLAIYPLFVGPAPPVVRAILAATVGLVGRAIGRDGDGMNTLAVVALAAVLWRPAVIHAPGFQLTFGATAGILALARRMAERLPLPTAVACALAVSTSAYLATAPAVAWHFGRLAPISPLTNLLALPLVAVAVPAGYGALLVEGAPGTWLAELAASAVGAVLRLARMAGDVEGGALPVARPTPVHLAIHLGLLAGFARPSRGGPSRVAALGVCTLALHLGPPPATAVRLEAHVLDVGQAQALVAIGPGGALLIDAGGAGRGFDAGERIVAPYLVDRGIRRLEALIVSHAHLDHAGGAATLLRELEIGELWIPALGHRSTRLAGLAALARRRGVAVRLAEPGGDERRAGLRLEVLAPDRATARAMKRANDRSLVIRMGTAPARLLVPGDLEPPGEQSLLRTVAELSAEALVLPHHGSRGGAGEALLERVGPSVAVVSAGFRNRFGHPHREVRERLRLRRVPLWRTDLHGRIRLIATDAGWVVRTTR